jgi:NAD(P)-dependent dehydrogenase (short-subunit alcohol dehydrogenase family)
MLTLNDVANASRHHVVKLSIPDADGGVPLLAALKSSSRHFREQALPARTSMAATAAGAPPRVRRVRAYSGPAWRTTRAGCSARHAPGLANRVRFRPAIRIGHREVRHVARMARPEEIASVVGFLAGEGASYLTATTIFTDGGIMHGSVGL